MTTLFCVCRHIELGRVLLFCLTQYAAAITSRLLYDSVHYEIRVIVCVGGEVRSVRGLH